MHGCSVGATSVSPACGGGYCKLKLEAGRLEKRFLKGDDPMGLKMGDEERSVDMPWLTGDLRQQLLLLGTFPWEVASSLGCWVWSWWPGWEIRTTLWAHPHPALGFWQGLGSVQGWGHWG